MLVQIYNYDSPFTRSSPSLPSVSSLPGAASHFSSISSLSVIPPPPPPPFYPQLLPCFFLHILSPNSYLAHQYIFSISPETPSLFLFPRTLNSPSPLTLSHPSFLRSISFFSHNFHSSLTLSLTPLS